MFRIEVLDDEDEILNEVYNKDGIIYGCVDTVFGLFEFCESCGAECPVRGKALNSQASS
jgi:hypothetical protein